MLASDFFWSSASVWHHSSQGSCYLKKEKKRHCKLKSMWQFTGQWELRTRWPKLCSSGALDSFLAIYFVKRKDLIPNIILKLHQEYCESYQVSSPGKCPTHLPSHMGPFYFVARVQGVPSVRRDTWTQIPFYFRLLIFFCLHVFLKVQVGEVVMHK